MNTSAGMFKGVIHRRPVEKDSCENQLARIAKWLKWLDYDDRFLFGEGGVKLAMGIYPWREEISLLG